jgi:hypothetical protein
MVKVDVKVKDDKYLGIERVLLIGSRQHLGPQYCLLYLKDKCEILKRFLFLPINQVSLEENKYMSYLGELLEIIF